MSTRRNRRSLFAGTLALLAAVAAPALAAPPAQGRSPDAPPPRFRILAPAENAVLSPGNVYVIGATTGGGPSLVKVSLDGKLATLATATGGGFWCRLQLSPGRHTIRAASGKDEATIPVSASSPADYRYHPQVEACEGCHPGPRGPFKADVPLAAMCGKCHKPRDAGKFVHGPVAAGGCLACHDPHGARNPRLQKAALSCFTCHQPFPAASRIHEPLKAGACGRCHNPHSADDRALLVTAGNELCASCHPEPHARHRDVANQGKITRVPDDFPRDKGRLACVGCHAPHQSNEEHLLREGEDRLCRKCHG